MGNGSIGFINIVAPIFTTKPWQSPFFNLFWKVTSKFVTCIYDPTLSHGETMATKVEPTIKVIVKYLTHQ
jgi:hypothetical protein